jgi:hypothetical protein
MVNPRGSSAYYPPPAPFALGQDIVEPPYLTRQDVEHLGLLSVGFYVSSAATALVGLLPMLPLAFSLAMAIGTLPENVTAAFSALPVVGWLMALMCFSATATAGAMAMLSFLAARALRARRGQVLVTAAAAFNLLHAPIGTLVGVLTLVVLSRASVRAAFEEHDRVPSHD